MYWEIAFPGLNMFGNTEEFVSLLRNLDPEDGSLGIETHREFFRAEEVQVFETGGSLGSV